MNNFLKALAGDLQIRFSLGVRSPEAWADGSMTPVVAAVERAHGSATIMADSRSITAALVSFSETGKLKDWRDLKYVCLGASMSIGEWSVLAAPRLRQKLTEAVANLPEARRRMKCFQALLSAYFAFPLYENTTTQEAKQGFEELRGWLRKEAYRLAKSIDHEPLWWKALAKHFELLSDRPCAVYGRKLLEGSTAELEDAIDQLSIPRTSWVVDEAVFSQMEAAADLADATFKKKLSQLIALATGQGGVTLRERLQLRCVACLVSRYSRCLDTAEHDQLRDAAVGTIGNPWVRRDKWDAWVLNAKGKPDDQAREMVASWLKRALISDFFGLLSGDDSGDPRRLEYWLRFEPFITDMWFALGSEAQTRKDQYFLEFRSRARGRLLDLEDPNRLNNAFVMRIGEFLAVEFGAKGNAFYLYRWARLSEALSSKLASGTRPRVTLKLLKDKESSEGRMNHIDSASATWEQKFDDVLCPWLGTPSKPPRPIRSNPAKRIAGAPTMAELRSFCRVNELNFQDLREKGGAIWVLGANLPAGATKQLEQWGFKQRPPRGWYKE